MLGNKTRCRWPRQHQFRQGRSLWSRVRVSVRDVAAPGYSRVSCALEGVDARAEYTAAHAKQQSMLDAAVHGIATFMPSAVAGARASIPRRADHGVCAISGSGMLNNMPRDSMLLGAAATRPPGAPVRKRARDRRRSGRASGRDVPVWPALVCRMRPNRARGNRCDAAASRPRPATDVAACRRAAVQHVCSGVGADGDCLALGAVLAVGASTSCGGYRSALSVYRVHTLRRSLCVLARVACALLTHLVRDYPAGNLSSRIVRRRGSAPSEASALAG
jgi:hypothetical protein